MSPTLMAIGTPSVTCIAGFPRRLETVVGERGLMLLDLGDGWVPYIFSESSSPEEEAKPNIYRPTYLALASGEFPEDRHGRRAQRDK